MRRIWIGCVALLAAFAGVAHAQSGLYDAVLQDGTRIAAEGEAAPGGGTYLLFSNVHAADSGDVAFQASVSGSSSGVFHISGGVPAAVARQGQAAPSASVGGVYLVFNSLDLNDVDSVAFNSRIDNLLAIPDSTAVFLNTGGVTTLLAEQGQPAPGTPMPGYNYFIPGPPAINDGDSVAFRSTLLDVFAQPHEGVFLATGGVVAPVVLETDTAPIGGTYGTFSSTVDLDDAGRVWFQNSAAIFVSDAGVETAVVQSGDATPAGGTFGTLGAFSVDEAGQLAFQAQVIGGSAASGIFLRAAGGGITALALQGGAAPGTGGGIFSILTVPEARPSLNDGGDATFFSNVVPVVPGGTLGGIFRVPAGGSVAAVAVRDAAVPSHPTSFYKAFSPPEIDDDGLTAYRAQLFADTDDDADGYVVSQDNCSLIANSSQCDTDIDGYGNHCDGDFDNNGAVGAVDFNTRFVPDFKNGADLPPLDGTDMDCNSQVNAVDFNTRFVPQFKAGKPGPSGLSCAGTVPCDL